MDPDAEYEYVKTKYAPFGVREAVVLVSLVTAVGVAARYRHVDWWSLLFLVLSMIGWELTKARLRSNAREFAQASRPPS
jgi:hypothetical protein